MQPLFATCCSPDHHAKGKAKNRKMMRPH
jgi:hypothetical protein